MSHQLLLAVRYRDEETDKVGFRGWARMAVPIEEFTIIEVRKPNVGENKPADVTADIVIDTSSEPSTCSCQHSILLTVLQLVCCGCAYAHSKPVATNSHLKLHAYSQ